MQPRGESGATWRVSTIIRHLWALLFVAGIGAAALLLDDGGDGESVSAVDAVMQPVPLVAALVAMAVAFLVAWLMSASLEGGPGWIARTRPKPPVRINVDEVVRVTRTRATVGKQSGATLAKMAFALETADGRKIRVTESAVWRKPSPLMQLYEQALAVAVEHAVHGLAAGNPVAIGVGTSILPDRIQFLKETVPLGAIGSIRVAIGSGVRIDLLDASGRSLGKLPDDEMGLQVLARLGKRIVHERVNY